MLARGFTTDLLVNLAHEGLATATPETVHAQAADRGCPGADHRCRTASAGRMMHRAQGAPAYGCHRQAMWSSLENHVEKTVRRAKEGIPMTWKLV
jgi:hypothetical protein